MLKYNRADKISLAGVLISFSALFFLKFLIYRPSRIMRGDSFSAHEILGGNFYFLLLGLALLFFLSLWKGERKWLNLLSVLLGAGFIWLTFYLAGAAAGKLTAAGTPFSRVSLGSGIWVAAFGAYLVVWGCGKKLARPSARFIVGALVPLSLLLLLLSGRLDGLSIMKEYAGRSETFMAELYRHLALSLSSVALGTLVGIALAFAIFSQVRREKYIFFFINLAQTIPTLSLLGLLMAPLMFMGEKFVLLNQLGIRGVGWAPAFVALFLYALLPVTGNALAGMRTVDQHAVEAARGMGMGPGQIFWKIQLPLALPVIISGIRTALTQSVGNTILAGLIGGGGLGSIIFLGLAQAAPDLILLGTIPVVLLALLADAALGGLAAYAGRPPGREG